MSQPLVERFAHQLKPYKDLAENFNIDLANELEEYVSELSNISVTFGEDGLSLNFAEAAMQLQGSAHVYSKKVEYLYNLIFTVMNNVLKRKTKATRGNSSINNNGDDLDVDTDDVFLHAPDDLIVEADVDLDELKTVVLRQLLIHPSLTLLNVQNDTINSLPANPISAVKLSNQAIGQDGALLLDSNVKTFEDMLKNIHGNHAALPFGSPLRQMKTKDLDFLNPDIFSAYSDDDDDYNANMNSNDLDDSLRLDSIDNLESRMEENEIVRLPNIYHPTDLQDNLVKMEEDEQNTQDTADQLPEEEDNHTNSVKFDVYAKLDHYDDAASTVRARKKATKPLIPELPETSFDIVDAYQGCTRFEDDLVLQASSRNIQKQNNIILPYNSDFGTLYVKSMSINKAYQRNLRLEQQGKKKSRSNKTLPRQVQMDARPLIDFDTNQIHDDFLEDGYVGVLDEMHAVTELGNHTSMHGNLGIISGGGVGGGDFIKKLEEVQMDEAQEFANLHQQNDIQPSLDAEIDKITQSYKDACKAQAQQYTQQTQEYRNLNKMEQRIRDWEGKLEDQLAEQERHGPFHIQEYCAHVVEKVKVLNDLDPKVEIPEKSSEAKLAETDKYSGDLTITPETNFADIMQGKPRHEVCRLFLSTLSLANSGTLDIFVDGLEEENHKKKNGKLGQNRELLRYCYTLDSQDGSSAELVHPEKITIKLLKESKHFTDELEDFEHVEKKDQQLEDSYLVKDGKVAKRGGNSKKNARKPKKAVSKKTGSKGNKKQSQYEEEEEDQEDFIQSTDSEGEHHEAASPVLEKRQTGRKAKPTEEFTSEEEFLHTDKQSKRVASKAGVYRVEESSSNIADESDTDSEGNLPPVVVARKRKIVDDDDEEYED